MLVGNHAIRWPVLRQQAAALDTSPLHPARNLPEFVFMHRERKKQKIDVPFQHPFFREKFTESCPPATPVNFCTAFTSALVEGPQCDPNGIASF